MLSTHWGCRVFEQPLALNQGCHVYPTLLSLSKSSATPAAQPRAMINYRRH